MDEQDWHNQARAASPGTARPPQPVGSEPGASGEWLWWRWGQRAGFTRREWRRLVFLRWLYRRGRLTEWC